VEVVAMKKRDAFTRGLAIAGTVLAWFPIAAALLTSRLFGPHPRIDYLIPAELFPLVVVGAIVLLWAARRLRSRSGLVALGLIVVIGAFVAVSLIATMSGLASGATRIESAPAAWAGIVASLVAYVLAVLELGVAGVLLTRDSFRTGAASGEPPAPVAQAPATQPPAEAQV
jgi:peptidoglycan/LPS O-acetylase OafA/YrhL